MVILLGVMVLGVIGTAYSASTFFGEDCDIYKEDRLNGKICGDLNNLNYRVIILENELFTMNTTLNDVTVRINELTVLHYPEDIVPITVTAPEIVPLPEYPTTGENPEFAPNTPEIDSVIDNSEVIAVNSFIMVEDIDDRYEEYPTIVLELSTNGTYWYIGDERQALAPTYAPQLIDRSVENYVEYLVRLYLYNEFGNSEYSLIWSGIPTEFSENTRVSISDVTDTYVEMYWYDVPTFSHIPLYWIVERSVNYDVFEVVEGTLDPNITEYSDTDVISGDIYSYRVTMVTDFETQTRSGFTTVLVP